MSRIITTYYDVVSEILRDSSGNELTRVEDYPSLSYKENPIVNLHLVTDASLTAYTGLGDSSDVYTAAIDSDFDHNTALMCKTEDTNINKAGDWAASSSLTADPSQGEFSIRLNANNTDFRDKLATQKEERDCWLELQTTDGGDIIFVKQIPIRCLNILDDAGSVPPVVGADAVVFGSASISDGYDYVAVTGLGLSGTPAQIIVTIRKPNDSSVAADWNIFACVRNDSISTDGFIADLSAEVDNASYKLDYIIKVG